MCGIAGYLGHQPPSDQAVQRTLQLMRSRGPDIQSSVRKSLGSAQTTLLHSRLSIIDLDPRSNQPFWIGNFGLVFNGEIYNYLELRKELESRGVQFRTDSDTEVLLHSYILDGPECVKKFEGMWSFALYDGEKNSLVLSRDRFGEKPLYYCRDTHGIYFGSETRFIKALAQQDFKINQTQVLRYLVNGFRALNHAGETFYSGITRFPARSFAVIDDSLKITARSFWTPAIADRSTLTRSAAVEGFSELFHNSIRLRLRADVPLAFCLSGGIDSASIVSAAAKKFGCSVATFSIVDHDPRYDERENILATVKDLSCASTLIPTSEQGFFERLQKLIQYHDAPLATISYYVHSFLSEAIAKQGFRVALSGTGADEMLSGYYDHFLLQLYELQGTTYYQDARTNWERWIKPLARNPFLQDPDLYLKNPAFRDHIYLNRGDFLACLRVPFTEVFEEQQYTSSLLRNRMLNEMFDEIVPVILHEDDLNSMLYSIENRSPFLDTKLFEFCLSVPPQWLIYDGQAKYLLRESMRGILNEKVRTDREKKGFNASLNSLVNFQDPEVRRRLLEPSPIFEIVDPNKIKEFFDYRPLPNSFSKFLFNFINAKLFLEQAEAGNTF